MADACVAIIDVERPGEHPAAVAWRRLDGTGRSPTAVRVLKESPKTLAYRLVACGPQGGDIVATQHATDATLVERRVYAEVLPQSRLRSIRLHGVIDQDDGTSWMFLDDAGEASPDLRHPDGRLLAGTWLGRLHVDLDGLPRPDGLPDRDADDALATLRSNRTDLLATIAGRYVDHEGRRFIGDLVRRLDLVEAAWAGLADQMDGLPSTLVHGDLVSKNLRIQEDDDGAPSIVAFDWEMSGWGVPLRDLALIDIGAYAGVAGPLWGGRARDLGRLADVGRLFGLLAAIGWEMPGLRSEWPLRFLDRLRIFHERLGTAAVRAGLSLAEAPRPRAPVGRRDVGLAKRRMLDTGLRSMEPHGAVRVIDVHDRAPNIYRSTFPSEIVRCTFDDGARRSVLVKRHVPGLHTGGRFWDGGPYEADIYRDILAGRDLGTPDYHGSWSDPASGDTFLALGYVQGWRLAMSEPSWLIQAARWLARLHRLATPIATRHPAVRVYDAAYLRHWSQRAVATVSASGAAPAWLVPLARTFDAVMVPRLLDAEATFIHGEPYPENLIVSSGAIRAVDWQSAAIGPGAIDLACVTEGGWPAELVRESESAYAAERWSGAAAPTGFAAELEAARLYWSMRWLGDEADATTAERHASYVTALHRSAERLGLVAAG